MLSKTPRFWSVIALVLSASLITPSWGRANERVSEFNIPPQALDSALLVFAEQADVQVSVSTVAVAGVKTQGVVGRFTPSVALARLLTETGLQFTTIGDRTYSVSQAAGSGSVRNGMTAGRAGDSMMTLAPEAAAEAPAMSSSQDSAVKPPGSPDAANTKSDSDRIQDEVIVTGTSIRGEVPVGSSVIVVDRDEIERAGFSTAPEIVRSLPQNFGGGPSEDTSLGLEAPTNVSGGTALNLRGLGTGSTLVLLNGHRLAAGGTEGTFTDVSSIPLTAIERVEVLTDGASAIYGSDAVGGVVNYILRKDFEGAETRARAGSVTSGDAREYQFGQALGTTWSTGNALVSLEYHERDALRANERQQATDSDLTALGGTNFSSTQSNPGTITIGTQTWAIPRGQDGRSLVQADFVEGTVNRQNLNEGRDLLGRQEQRNAFAAISQGLGSHVELFAEALYGERDFSKSIVGFPTTLIVPTSNAFYVNPTGGTGPVRVRYNLIEDLGPRKFTTDMETMSGAAGLSLNAPRDWRVTASWTFGREEVSQFQENSINTAALAAALADSNPATAFNPFGDGSFTNPSTLESIRASTLSTYDSELRAGNLSADGALFGLPGGDVKLAVGADYRTQSFSSFNRAPGFGSPDSGSNFQRRIKAGFAELLIPIAGTTNHRAGMRRLEFSVAGRYDNYDDFGSTTNPKFGALWSPAAGFNLRGTWGTSFRAPNLADLDTTNNGNFIFPIADPQSPTGFSPIHLLFGKNSELSEETATIWTVGMDLTPDAVKGLYLGLSYFDIEFKDRIRQLPAITTLADPRFVSFITRNPTAAQRQAACNQGAYLGAPGTCLTDPIEAIVDNRVSNASVVTNSGLDFVGYYDLASTIGTFNIALNATYVLELSEAATSNVAAVDLQDTVNNPLRLRLRGSVSWDRGPLNAAAFLNHAGGYTDNLTVPNRDIDPWTTMDLQLGYRTTDSTGGWLKGVALSINVMNVFDEEPPFVNNAVGVAYDQENADLLGRFVALQLRKDW